MPRQSKTRAAAFAATFFQRAFPVLYAALLLLTLFHTPRALAVENEKISAAYLAFQAAYPGLGCDLQNEGENIWLECQNGKRLLFVDSITRAAADLPDSPAIIDQFAIVYPPEMDYTPALNGEDPGRTRNYPLLAALYGQNRAEVEANLEQVDFLGQKVRFNKNHGASQALANVASRLAPLLEQKTALRAWLLPLGGDYFWRTISGEKRLSAHSYGIAIDLNPKKGIYWRWKPSKALLKQTRENFPAEIVQAFEAEGFIWGGKWSHFDFMHFEYRPEVVKYSLGDDFCGKGKILIQFSRSSD